MDSVETNDLDVNIQQLYEELETELSTIPQPSNANLAQDHANATVFSDLQHTEMGSDCTTDITAGEHAENPSRLDASTSHKLQHHSTEIIAAAIKDLQHHRNVSFKPDFGKEIDQWCQLLTSEIRNPDISEQLMKEIQPVVEHINGQKVKHSDIDKLCGDLYKLKVQSSTQNSIVARLLASSTLQYKYANFIKHMMSDSLVKAATKVLNTSVHETYGFTATSDVELDEVEQNVVRYCAGFIMYKFMKYLDSRVGLLAARYGNLIMSFQDEDHPCDRLDDEQNVSFMDYSKKLIHSVNRGGLFIVNDRAFSFFCELERVVKPHLSAANIHQVQKTSAAELEGHLLQTMRVHSSWEILCYDAPEDLDLIWLLEKIVMYWLKLRMKAFATAYMYARRRMNSRMDEKGAISMRKKLKRN